MGKAKKIIKWILPISALFGAIWISLVLYDAAVESNPFLTTSSPTGTYTVNLTGQKERPFFFINTVNFNVLKNGKPYIPSTYLHSGDFMDLWFELGYPNHRWLDDNVIQFYREQNFNDGTPDILIVENKTDKTIKFLRVHSIDKFLLFDMQPTAIAKTSVSPPRGGLKWVEVEGEFSNGQSIKWNGVDFITRKELAGPFTYYIYVNDSAAVIESPQLEKYQGRD